MADKLTKGQRTQLKIIETTLSLIGTNGFERTSIQLIATDLKMSQTAVLRHFPNRESLFEGVRKYVTKSNYDYVSPKISMEDSALVCLEKHFRGNLEWAHKHRDCFQIILLTYYQGCFSSAGRLVVVSVLDLARQKILGYLYAGLREKILKFDVDPEKMAETLHSYLLGSVIKSVTTSSQKTAPKETAKCYTQFLANILCVSS